MNSSNQNKLVKLAPSQALILMSENKGSVSIVFSRAASVELPSSVKFTDAIGSFNKINGQSFTFAWEGTPSAKPDNPDFLVCTITVNSTEYVEPNTQYNGKIIFIWSDHTQAEDLSVVSRVNTDFEIDRQAIDIRLGPWQAESLKVRIKNTGKSNISTIDLLAPDLSDQTTANRISWSEKQNMDIGPGVEKEVSFALPKATLAGSYSGQAHFIADGKTRKSITATFHTRGPILSVGSYALPFILFLLVLGVGYWVSNLLEEWFGLGGLQRAQAFLSFKKSETGLINRLKFIEELESKYSVRLPRARIAIGLALSDVSRVLENANGMALEPLVSEAQRFAKTHALFEALWAAVMIAKDHWSSNPDKFKQVVTALDNVEVTELEDYRKALQKVLQDASAGEEGGAMVAKEAGALPADVRYEDLPAKIKRMALLYRLVVWVVVFAFAYVTFYASDFDFGKFTDYLSLFLWTIGLTNTGTQILTRAGSSYARPQG
jgi:hypothetical protein